jgi:hypothetical protein
VKLGDLYTPMSFLIRDVHLGRYGEQPSRAFVVALTLLSALPWMAIALLGLAGLIWLPARGRGLLALWLAYHVAVHAATVGMSRYRMVAEPFLIVAAAPLLVQPWGALVARAGPVRLGAAMLGWFALLASWAGRAGSLLDSAR